MKKYHYVYKITNLNPQDERKYYIGVRSSKLKPEEDTKYQSSSKYLKQALKEIGHNNFKKEILSIWNTRKEANQEEIRLHELYDVAKNPNYYNKARATSTKFCTEGQVTVIDTRDGKTKNVTKDEYNECVFYVSPYAGKVTVFDISTQTHKMVTNDEYYQNDNYIYHRSKTFKIYNNDDELIETVYGNFETFCKSNGYPFRVLVESYLNDGRKIYSKFSNPRNPKIKFKGWYAIREE